MNNKIHLFRPNVFAKIKITPIIGNDLLKIEIRPSGPKSRNFIFCQQRVEFLPAVAKCGIVGFISLSVGFSNEGIMRRLFFFILVLFQNTPFFQRRVIALFNHRSPITSRSPTFTRRRSRSSNSMTR